METLSPTDVAFVVNMVLRENKGNMLSEALAIGIEQSVKFYCGKLKDGSEQGLRLLEQQKREAGNA